MLGNKYEKVGGLQVQQQVGNEGVNKPGHAWYGKGVHGGGT